MSDYTYIGKDSQLVDYLQRLKEREIRVIALDLEGEFNLHVYGERFCLLQAFDGREEVVVDPFTTSIDLIKQFLENRDLLKIMYDCASDRALLFKSHRIAMNSILDLRPAVDLLGFQKQDLKSVLDAALGVYEPGNKKRFQQHDWTRRPIDPSAISYALEDVRHLFALKEALIDRLVKAGQMESYILENLKRQDRTPVVDRKPGIFRSGRHARLSRDQQKEFRRIYDIRERCARELDLPPNTVLANNDLFAVVTGEMDVADARGNRRMPADSLQALIQEISQTSSG
ncbi:MAG: 3'-5' exonuclease [Spirochaetia bacterium]